MNRNNIEAPDGMLKAAMRAWGYSLGSDPQTVIVANIVGAALRWLSENPIVPTDEQLESIRMKVNTNCHSDSDGDYLFTNAQQASLVAEWQRRMFLAPEPKVPEAIRDLLWMDESQLTVHGRTFDEAALEAYRRGQKEGW